MSNTTPAVQEAAKTLRQKIALVKATLGPVVKAAKNEQYKYSYANLSDIFRACHDAMAEQFIEVDIEGFTINKELSEPGQWVYDIPVTIIDLDSGEEIKRLYQFPMDDYGQGTRMKKIQAAGSTMTYATRYIYGSIFSIQLEEDPDASTPEKPVEEKVWLTEEQFKIAMAANAKQVKGVIAKFTGPGHAMKKQYREALQKKLSELQNS